MNILYGVQSTGNGHITRSSVIIDALKSKHNVDVILSGKNSSIDLSFKPLEEFNGLSLYSSDCGKIDWIKTTYKNNIFKFLSELNYNVSNYDLVISDFEPISAWSAKNKIKTIGFGNQYSLLEDNIPKANKDFISELFIKKFAPCQFTIPIHYQSYNDNIFQPVIDPLILKSKNKNNGFILVYLPYLSLAYITELMTMFKNIEFKVYSNIKEDFNLYNVKVRKINSLKFKDDLSKCNGVITNSGFSTTSEALVLGKKLWSIPVKGHYEQLSNAIALKQMGIFTDSFNLENLAKWLFNIEKIEYKWKNPVNSIIKKINQIYES